MNKPLEHSDVSTNVQDDDYTETVQVASEVFDLVAKYMTPPRPRTYALWYSYASRDNEALCADVENVLRKSGTLSNYDIEQILAEHNEAERQLIAAQDEIGDHVAKELSTIQEKVRDSVSRSADYSRDLNAASEALPDLDDPEHVKSLVQSLMARNREMYEQTRGLTEHLAQSQEHIQSLRDDLAELRARSLRDPLTQIGNRAYFDAALSKEIATARAGHTPMCLVMADIDHFKHLNDNYGHLIGDWVLKDFAALLSASVKGRDAVARYGGEEFAIILPVTGVVGARVVVEKIREDFAAKERVLKASGQELPKTTASFGIAELAPEDDYHSLIARADKNLYAAKRGGRNRTVND